LNARVRFQFARKLNDWWKVIEGGEAEKYEASLRFLYAAQSGHPGCLQLLEILEISLNLYGPPGNFCIKCRWSTALVSSHDKTGYQIAYLRNWPPFFIIAMAQHCAYHVFVWYLGKLVDSVHCIAGRSSADFSWNPSWNLLEICSVESVDTLSPQLAEHWVLGLTRHGRHLNTDIVKARRSGATDSVLHTWRDELQWA